VKFLPFFAGFLLVFPESHLQAPERIRHSFTSIGLQNYGGEGMIPLIRAMANTLMTKMG
jgi:hypothetical protein